MKKQSRATTRLVALLFTASLLFGALGPAGAALAASGTVLVHLDGGGGSYTDRYGTKTLLGSPQFSSYGRAFNVRMPSLTPPRDSRLGAFPYGAYGLTGTDTNGDQDYTDDGEVDPVRLMDAMKSDGVYGLTLSSTLGRISNEAEVIRVLEGARDRGMKLVVRATELIVTTSTLTTTSEGTTVTRKSRREGLKEQEFLNRPDTPTARGVGGNTRTGTSTDTGTGDLTTMAGSEVFTMDATATNQNLQRLKRILTQRPDLESVIHSWYSLDEPMQRNMSLSELQKIYKAHKDVFPSIPVFICYNQNTSMPDYNGDGLSDGLLGQPENPYGPGVANIVGLNIYIASVPNYNYGAIRQLYSHARRVVNKVSTATPIWAVPQAHGLVVTPSNTPRPHHLYRQANDWFRAGPDTGLRGFDGLLWYSWHFEPRTVQNLSDLEDNHPARQMAIRIGQRIRAGAMVTHKLPYRSELYLSSTPSSTIRIPRAGNLDLGKGTVTLSVSHPWAGNDGLRHVLLDTGASSIKNRLLLEKTSGNILRLVVTDKNGIQKWTGVAVDTYNMPGSGSYSPGYSDIALTWNNGQLGLYLDGARGSLGGGTGTGVLSSGGSYIFLGTTVEGTYGANGTFSYMAIRNAAMTAAEVNEWTTYSHVSYAPARVTLSSPASGTSTTDTTPTLSWYGASRAVKYQVQISRYTSFSTLVRNVGVTGTSHTTPTRLTRGYTYYWRVRTLDNYGSGGWSAYRSFTVK